MGSARLTPLLLVIAAGAVVGAALLSEHVGGLVPCELCLAERWPYYIILALNLIAVLVGNLRLSRLILSLSAIVFLVSAGLGAYHVGVEQHWIVGPTACTGGETGGAKSIEDLQKMLLQQQPVRCDEVQWSLFGISLAGWNFLISLALLAFTASRLRQIGRSA
ncbi:MAG TPA: disulfide bond formation protein B [Stellaceae bacterium]|nr:disulfide bond formation protein B [Stellaceae bacterium]